MTRPYNKNIQLDSCAGEYTIKQSLEYIANRLRGTRSRTWLYRMIKSKGIELRKNGKMSFLLESDLKEMTKILTISEIVNSRCRND